MSERDTQLCVRQRGSPIRGTHTIEWHEPPRAGEFPWGVDHTSLRTSKLFEPDLTDRGR